MNFGSALLALKNGTKMQRVGWNGKGMYLELQVPDEHSKMTHPYLYFTIPNCEEGTRRIPYVCTTVDMFAEDWQEHHRSTT